MDTSTQTGTETQSEVMCPVGEKQREGPVLRLQKGHALPFAFVRMEKY